MAERKIKAPRRAGRPKKKAAQAELETARFSMRKAVRGVFFLSGTADEKENRKRKPDP